MPIESYKSSLETSEIREGLFLESTEQGIKEALSKIQEKYEDSPQEQNNLDYHNREHTEMVMERTAKILQTIREADPGLIKERDITLGRLAAAFHDIVVNWKADRISNKEGGFKIIRKRFIGPSEEGSAEEAVAFMDKVNQESAREVFSSKDKEAVKEAIKVTTFDIKEGVVIQPNLTKESPPVVRAVALADLGGAGMAGPEVFLLEGDKLFREDNLDIRKAVKNLQNISEEQKEYYKKRILAWSEGQVGFAQGRKALLKKELSGLPEPARSRVAGLFNQFDQSLLAAKERAQRRREMTFEELLEDMGYR